MSLVFQFLYVVFRGQKMVGANGYNGKSPIIKSFWSYDANKMEPRKSNPLFLWIM